MLHSPQLVAVMYVMCVCVAARGRCAPAVEGNSLVAHTSGPSVRIPHGRVRGGPEQEPGIAPKLNASAEVWRMYSGRSSSYSAVFLLFPIKNLHNITGIGGLALQWFVKQCVHCCPRPDIGVAGFFAAAGFIGRTVCRWRWWRDGLP